MEYHKKVEAFENFFREAYDEEITAAISCGKRAVVVDFNEFSKFDNAVADTLLDHPEEGIDAASEALSNLPMVEFDMLVHFENLPSTEYVFIRNLRSRHIGKFLGVKGLIKRASEVRPELESAIFECSNCGDRFEKEQDSSKITTPHKCDCGSRSFNLVDKVMRDVQTVTVEENPETIKGAEQPRKIGVILRDDLVDPQFQNRVVPGNKVIINGILREKAIKKDSKRYDLYIEANYLETVQREFEEIEIDEEEEEAIEQLSNHDELIDKMIASIAPSIHGHTHIKEAIALQLFSGVRKERPDGTTTRGDIHVLLIGEPGTGKSQLLKFTGNLAPKGKYVVGKAATAAGITATVMKDEITDEWTLEAGALVLANKGIATIDEIDKMEKGDRSSMHEAMEQQSITVSKANIQATLQCRTSILAAGNPKFGRFDPYRPVAEQIEISDTLISRFDLLFPVKDIPDVSRDQKLSDHIMSMHTDPKDLTGEISLERLRNYIAYAKRNVHPKLSEKAQKVLKEFYVDTRQKGTSGEEGQSKVPITARQLEAIIRLSEASARLRLSDVVEERDAQRAIDLLTYSLKKIGVISESGEYDIDKLETGMDSESRSKRQTIMKVVDELSGSKNDPIPFEELIETLEDEGIEKEQAEEVVNKLIREGELYEPKQGFIDVI